MQIFIQMYSGVNTKSLIKGFLSLGGSLKKAQEYIEKLNIEGLKLKENEDIFEILKNTKREDIKYENLIEIIKKSNIEIKDKVANIFEKLGKSYGKNILNWKDKVLKIVAILGLVEDLNIHKIYISPIAEGNGIDEKTRKVVPSQEVIDLLSNTDIKINIVNEPREKISLNAVSILSEISSTKVPEFQIKSSVTVRDDTEIRILEIETEQKMKMKMLNTNIDDSSSEVMSFVMEKLMEVAGDVYFTPVYMKKNRPAYNLTVTYMEKNEEKIEDIIFKHTTSIGLKKTYIQTRKLDTKKVSLKYNDLDLKLKLAFHNNQTYVYPEYESVRELSKIENMPVNNAYIKIKKLWEGQALKNL